MFNRSRTWSDGDKEKPAANSSPRWSPNFEMIDGLLYRKKLEKGYINYREVLGEDRRQEAISTFHRRRPGQRHFSQEETYKCVAENYWWEGMYFHIRDFVLSCPDCQSQHSKKSEKLVGRGCVTKTMASHSCDVLNKLRSQREAGLFCDITLRTNGRSFSAHRAVLAAVSDHFQEIFTQMDSNKKADIDLTGFSEDSLLSLLDFSYSSTLRVRQADLSEVCAMARHLGMWPAVEACSALIKEQERTLRSGASYHRHRRREASSDGVNDHFSLTLESSDESLHQSPRRNLRRTPNSQNHNGLPLSPTHRMKLMDFKSPSSKKACAPRAFSPVSPSSTRLLRSSPGAAKEVQRLLPVPETPKRSRKPHSIARLSSRARAVAARSPGRLKHEPDPLLGIDEEDYARAQEKYKLMNVLGLQRTALLPRPEDLIGWRQKKRLRKLKANNYSLTKRRKPRVPAPYEGMVLSLPLCDPVNTRLLSKSVRAKASIAAKRQRTTKQPVPPTDRSMRSKATLPDLFQPTSGRELRRSVRKRDDAHVQQPRRTSKAPIKTKFQIKAEPVEYSVSGVGISPERCHAHSPHKAPPTPARNKNNSETLKAPRYNRSRPAAKTKARQGSTKEIHETKCKSREEARKVGGGQSPNEAEPNGFSFSGHASPPSVYNHALYKAIKEEPADPIPVAGPFPDPPSPDLGKRQSKPPIKLLDSGFLFSFYRPAGGPMMKKEEESVDICLTRSVTQVRERFQAESSHRSLRARAPPAVKRETTEVQVQAKTLRKTPRNVALHPAKCTRSKTTGTTPKVLPLSGRSCAMLDAIRRARLKQLRGPRSQAPKVPKAAHTCQQCPAAYKDCDALIMHRLRHIEGKHWPCPLCSKTFFRLRNVRNHIRTHDPKLYKCRSCISAGS